jgi:hypothetical protein
VLDNEHFVAMIDWQLMSATDPTPTVAFCERSKDDSLRPTSGSRFGFRRWVSVSAPSILAGDDELSHGSRYGADLAAEERELAVGRPVVRRKRVRTIILAC